MALPYLCTVETHIRHALLSENKFPTDTFVDCPLFLGLYRICKHNRHAHYSNAEITITTKRLKMIHFLKLKSGLFCLVMLAVCSWQISVAQVSISAHNADFSTNFNGWNGTLPTGFTRYTSNNYIGNTATTSGGVYAIPNKGFGYRPSSNASATNCWLSGTYQNNTGSTITSLDISYEAFQIEAASSRIPNWTVTSSLGNVSALSWTFNATGVPTQLSTTLTVNIAPGGTFTLTFSSDRGTGSGSSPIIGLNNIDVRSNVVVAACPYPANLAENNVTQETADFNWDIQGSNGYQYALSTTPTTPTGAGTPTTQNSWSTTGLTPATNYYFYLRTDCGAGVFSAWTMVNFTTPHVPCPEPMGLIAGNLTDQMADFSWDPQTGNNFEYVLNQLSGDPVGAGTPTSMRTYQATGLQPLTMYHFHVRTNCGNGNFSPWITTGFTTHPTPCSATSGTAVGGITDAAATLSWNAQGNNTFEYTLDVNATDPVELGTQTSATSFQATGLESLIQYYFHIRTNCGGGNYSPWTTISFTTLVTPCPATSGTVASPVGHTSALLSWDEASNNTFEYVLDEQNSDPLTGTPISESSFNATGLQPLTTYFFHVRTNCGGGNFSPWTTTSFTTLETPCSVPSGLTVVDVFSISADLAWESQTGAFGYEYVLSQSNTLPTGGGIPISENTLEITALTPSTTYYVHIRTNCGNNNFSSWATISFTTTEISVPPCNAPSGITTDIRAISAVVSWHTQTGIAGYSYIVSPSPAAPTGAGSPIGSSGILELDGLSPTTTYYVHLRTNCANGNSSIWVTISFTTASNLGLEETQKPVFSAYPNPATQLVNIQSPLQEGTITLVNLNGQPLRTIDLKTASAMELSGIASGLYLLRYEVNGTTASVRLIIE
jgi:hypothetical protein